MIRMVIGILHVDVHLPEAHSLKDKRSVIKSLRDQLRGRFNIAVAESEPNEKWQRSAIAIAALGADRTYVQAVLRQVEQWIRDSHLVNLIQIEEEYL